jgi:UDP-N-acetylglucosamine transferase subunit ALG13
MPFDELFEEIDRLAGMDFFGQEVICQIGPSQCVPKKCRSFRFEPNLERYIAEARALVIHGGTGSVIEALSAEKPFVAMANPRAADDHQSQFLERMGREYGIVWGRRCSDLAELYKQALSGRLRFPDRDSQSLARAILALC